MWWSHGYICQTNRTLDLRTVYFLLNHILKKREMEKKNAKHTHTHTKELDWVNMRLKAGVSYMIWLENKNQNES